MTNLFDKHDTAEHKQHLENLARHRRDEGIEKSATGAGDDWISYATKFVHDYLLKHQHMHVDDLWDSGLKAGPSDRGLGQVIKHAVKQEWIEKIIIRTDAAHADCVARPSVRSNMQLKPVWWSLIYRRGEV